MLSRRSIVYIVSPVLTLSLGTWVLTTALDQTIGKPDQTKALLHKSGVYQAVVPSAVADAAKNNPTLASLPLDNPTIQKALAKSYNSQKIEAEGDQAVDGIYAWLDGDSKQPKISIDVAPDTAALAQAASDYAGSLPPCGAGQTAAAFLSDPLSATCLPAGVSKDSVRTFIASQIVGNPALTSIPPITQDDIKVMGDMTIMDSFASAPWWYHWTKQLPMISIIVASVCSLLLLAVLSPLRGAKSISKHFLSVGIVLGLSAFLLAWALSKGLTTLLPKADNPTVGHAVAQLTVLFTDAYRSNIILLSSYLAAAGAVLLTLVYLASLTQKHTHATAAAAKPALDDNRATMSSTAPTAKAKKSTAAHKAKKLAAKAKTTRSRHKKIS